MERAYSQCDRFGLKGATSSVVVGWRQIQEQVWREVGLVFVEGTLFWLWGRGWDGLGWVVGEAQVNCKEEMCFLYSRLGCSG